MAARLTLRRLLNATKGFKLDEFQLYERRHVQKCLPPNWADDEHFDIPTAERMINTYCTFHRGFRSDNGGDVTHLVYCSRCGYDNSYILICRLRAVACDAEHLLTRKFLQEWTQAAQALRRGRPDPTICDEELKEIIDYVETHLDALGN